MAYTRQHDPYYGQAPQSLVPDYPPQQPAPINTNQYDYDTQWDTKSAHSIHSSAHGSQVHLNPEYNMSRPNLPYAFQANYPPVPPMVREMSIGYSVAREKLMKRRSVRQVELQNGNLVLDAHVPSHIVPKTMSDVEEMTKLRYTAATCDPDEFVRKKYSLRPYLYGRRTELFIVMTMYNEDEILFVKTMNAYATPFLIPLYHQISCSCSVIKNIAHLCSRSRSRTWGVDGWKKVVVCIVSDGRNKINKRTLQVLTLVQ